VRETLKMQAERRLAGEIPDERFRAEISTVTDVGLLRSLAEEFTPHSEISIPAYQRILEIHPEDPDALVDLGFVYWLCGEDDEARDCLNRAYSLDSEHQKALLLDAALEPDYRRKRTLYERALERDPANQVAIANLREMSGAKDS
jgi:tetratricopeptide (TPR) repeat protein